MAVLVLSTAYTVFAMEGVHCGFLVQRTTCGDWSCSKDSDVCMPCTQDSDCYPGRMYCHQSTGQCKLRGCFTYFTYPTIAAVIIAILVCSVAVIAGVGGGGILVPMFTALMEIPMATAVGFSQSTICGQSLLNVSLLAFKKFPHETWVRPLINYQYLSLMLPLGLIGTHVGSTLSKICPDFVRLILLFVLLTLVLIRTVRKLRAQYAQDKAKKQQERELEEKDVSQVNPEMVPPAANPREDNDSPRSDGEHDDDAMGEEAKQDSHEPVSSQSDDHLHPADQEQWPLFEIIVCVFSFALDIAFVILMHFTTCGGTLYWVYFCLPIALLLGILYVTWRRLNIMSKKTPERLTFKWGFRTSLIYPLIAVVAGMAASMLGLGGGLVLGFVLYESLAPEEASATSGSATFFLSFSAAIPQIISGTLPIDYGVVLFVVGLGATALGQFVFMAYIRKHGLRFLMVGSLALILCASLMTLGGYGIYDAVVVSRSGESLFSLGKLCGVHLETQAKS